jgi:hypothetical protein
LSGRLSSGRLSNVRAVERAAVSHGEAGSLARRARTELGAHRAGLAAEVHVEAGDQSLSVAHVTIVRDISYKVN